MFHTILFVAIAQLLPFTISGQRFQLRLDGAIDGTFINTIRSKNSEQVLKSPWRHARTLFIDRLGLTSTLTVDYDHLTETVSLANALSHIIDADDTFDYGLTAHLFTSTTSGVSTDPSNLDVHVLLHAATDVPAFLAANLTEVCITVAFKSDTLQSHSVCSLSWPYDTVCIVGRSLDRRWFIGNKSVNVSFSLRPVTASSFCTVNHHDIMDTSRIWHNIGRVAAPSLTGPLSFSSKLLESHHPVELASSEVGRGKAQVSLFLPPRDTYFRAGDLLRLPVHLNPGNSLASLLIRVNASPSLQLSEMRLLHPDWRLSIISDSNNRVAVIRATADPTSNSSALLGGPLLEYDFRVVTSSKLHEAQATKSTASSGIGTEATKSDQKHRAWSSLDAFTDDLVVGRMDGGTTMSSLTAAGLSWEIEMVSRDSAAVGLAAVDAVFRLDNDPIIAIIPVVKVSHIYNYAVLRDSIQRIPIWIYGYTAQAGLIQLWDGECLSSDPDVLKVETLCRFVYLDGSETKGSDNITITITRRRLVATLKLSVMFPELPLRLDVSDSTLQLIRNFLVPVSASNKKSASKADNNSHKCRSHFQRAIVRVFARFSYYTHNSPFYIEAEVTEWVRPLVRILNSSVADYDGHSIVGHSPGHTMVQLITAAGQLIASRPITVSSAQPVSITRLDALIADRIDISIVPSQSTSSASYVADNNADKLTTNHAFFDVTASLRRVISGGHRPDEPTASPSRLFVVAHFSDGTFLDLATLPSNWYELSIQPAANSDATAPRVALFEVAKCRRQSVDEGNLASTVEPHVTVSPLSVIRIDGSQLLQNELESSPSNADRKQIASEKSQLSNTDDNGDTRNSSDTTTVVLGVVLGVLLVFLLVLAIVSFRRRLITIVQIHFHERISTLPHISACYQRVMHNRLTKYLLKFVRSQKQRHQQDQHGSVNAGQSVNIDDDNDIQSCAGDEFDDVCEASSRPDRNWVWLSRETLEKHSVETMRSHPLLPDAAFRSLCCSAGTGTGARSPAISTTGSQASRSGRSSAAPLLRNALPTTGSNDEAYGVTSCFIEDSPTEQRATSPRICNSNITFKNSSRNLTPTVYTGSECSLRILPCQTPGSNNHAALQLVAADGRLMATAFASRTLNSDHKRRVRGFPNHLPQALNRGQSVIETTVDNPERLHLAVSDTTRPTSSSSSRDQVRFCSLPKPPVDSSGSNEESDENSAENSKSNFSNNGPSTQREYIA